MISEILATGVMTAGSGRGFVVEGAGERLVITAAHCLPFLPPAPPSFGPRRVPTGRSSPPVESAPRLGCLSLRRSDRRHRGARFAQCSTRR